MKQELPDWVGREAARFPGRAIEPGVLFHALSRLAFIFQTDPERLNVEDEFGTSLNATFVSDFRKNELDRVAADVADIESRLRRAQRVKSVRDFVELLAACHALDRPFYKKLVDEWEIERNSTPAGRILRDWFGLLPRRFQRGKQAHPRGGKDKGQS